jgi:hypothetical protein
MYLASLFHHQSLLQVRLERAIGGSLGEGAGMSEGCGFSTVCAFSHWITSFLAIIPVQVLFLRARHFTTRLNGGQDVNWI